MIVDENGKPFKRSMQEEILAMANKKLPVIISDSTENPLLHTVLMVSELRRSCGVNEAVTFRRYLPYGNTVKA